mgnify:FL=1|jgi:hypothetical protein
MIVGVQGTSSFDNYNVFLRSMAVALSELLEEDKNFHIYSAGPNNINMMAMEFSNLSEKGMKSRGKSIKFIKVTPQWLEENISEVNHFAFLSNPKEPVSKIVHVSKLNNINTNVYNF